MPPLPFDPLLMSALVFILLLLGLPAAAIAAVVFRLRAKERARDAYLGDVREALRAAGYEPLGDGNFRKEKRHYKVEAGTNPLFTAYFSVRLAAYSSTIHEFELRRGQPLAPERAAFGPILERWESAGKMFVEVYAAGLRRSTDFAEDLRLLDAAAAAPLSKAWGGGTFTIREGFEPDVPQWHWKPEQRRRLMKGTRRFCVSYWQGDPYLNGGLARLFEVLAGTSERYWISDAEDLRFLDYAFGPYGWGLWGPLLTFPRSDHAIAADLYLDGEFFGGVLAADDVPPGWGESEHSVPRYQFHDQALKSLRWCAYYARRLFDEEHSWYSGEYEILMLRDLDVRAAVKQVAQEFGAQVLEIDRRFNKRILFPPA